MEPLAARKGAEGRGGRPEQKDKGKEAGICSLWPLLQLVQEAEAKATECAVRSLIPSWGGGGGRWRRLSAKTLPTACPAMLVRLHYCSSVHSYAPVLQVIPTSQVFYKSFISDLLVSMAAYNSKHH